MDQSAPDIEVYRCFNAGRYKAFQERYGEDMQIWQIPAASAVGALDNVLSIQFFASDAPSLFFENKIQIPAYQYSLKYGKLPPVFSRGAICGLNDATLLFISGTASVVQEDTAFVDDICGQIHQTFKNIHTLINRSNLQIYGLNYEFGFEDLVYLRVYYKNSADKPIIESQINNIITGDCRISYVNTDICRKELVFEIEGICRKTK
jgi:enamine deaminase RidA (YjgF/YER057c/UK114 family)